MDQLQSMRVFTRVAHHLGFAAAARELGLSPGAVTKHVNALEAHVGARLFDRTTRSVGLTEAGRMYLERCLECLLSIDDADASVGELTRGPKGNLRVTAPIDFGEPLQPVIAALLAANDELTVDLRLSNRVVDMVEEGIDVGVRVAPSLDGRYVARPVAQTRIGLYASPDYLDRRGRPRRPADLASHRGLIFVEPRPLDELTLTRGKRSVRVKLPNALCSNNGATLIGAAIGGAGITLAPSFLVWKGVAAGQLEPVLSEWALFELRVFAIYPHRRFLSPKVRLFVDLLCATFGDGKTDPWAAAMASSPSVMLGHMDT